MASSLVVRPPLCIQPLRGTSEAVDGTMKLALALLQKAPGLSPGFSPLPGVTSGSL